MRSSLQGVPDSSKLQIQKQITTEQIRYSARDSGVPDSSKLQIQKQITTIQPHGFYPNLVFPIVQSYKFKSKSQLNAKNRRKAEGVPDSSKLQIQKQITTQTNGITEENLVFPIVQSYKFKSKSQQRVLGAHLHRRCSR